MNNETANSDLSEEKTPPTGKEFLFNIIASIMVVLVVSSLCLSLFLFSTLFFNYWGIAPGAARGGQALFFLLTLITGIGVLRVVLKLYKTRETMWFLISMGSFILHLLAFYGFMLS